jgi:hypothetical protein
MKKALIVLAMTLIPSLCFAGPFLTCTSIPAGSVDSIGVTMDASAEVFVSPKVNPDGTLTLWYDLATVTVGNHNVVLRPKKGVWYGATTPSAFPRPAVIPILGVALSE